jgi:large subunit ribosomal protein L20
MPRAKGGAKTRRRRKKILKKAKGYFGGRRKLYKTAAETVLRAGAFGLSYSKFMAALKKAGVNLDRKVLAELAVTDPSAFAKLTETAKAQSR